MRTFFTVLFLFFLCAASYAQQDTLSVMSSSTLNVPHQKWYQSKYVKESIAPVSLAAASGIILAIPDLKENLQNKLNWNDDLKPGYVNMGDDYIRYLPTVATYVLGDILSDYGFRPKHRFIDRTVILAVSYIASDFVVHNTKHWVKSIRPGRGPESTDYSFPSQHTAMAFVGATFLHHELGYISPWISVAGYLTACYVGYSRIARNRHWTSDVLMGAAVGILMTNASYWAYDGIMGLFSKKDELTVTPYFDVDNTAGVAVCYRF